MSGEILNRLLMMNCCSAAEVMVTRCPAYPAYDSDCAAALASSQVIAPATRTAWYQCPFAGLNTGVDCAAPGRASAPRRRAIGRRRPRGRFDKVSAPQETKRGQQIR